MTSLTLLALSLAAKATITIAVAAILATTLRRRPAAVRHLVWAAAVAALALLPVVTPTVPPFGLDIPVVTAAPAAVAIAQADFLPANDVAATTVTREPQSPVVVTRPVAAPHHVLMPWWLATWLSGTLALLAWTFFGQWRMHRVIARAEDATLLVGAGTLAILAEMLQLKHLPEVRLSTDIESPLMGGLAHPVILLPIAATGWSAERRRIVLIHELAHAARCDHLVQLVGNVGRALFWFHPGAWYAAARLRVEGEHAADDRVIAAGHPGISYATHLLEIARMATRQPLAGAIAMARPTQLEGRVHAMLQSNRPRGAVTRRHQFVAALAALAAALPLAGLRIHTIAAQVPAQSQRRADAVPAVASPDTIVRKSIPAAAGGVLHLDLQSSADIVIRATDDAAVRATARMSATSAEPPTIELERTADGVSLTATFPTPVRSIATMRQVEVLVPRQYSVSIESADGSVRIDGVEGNISGHTSGGDVMVAHASGMIRFMTGGGSVTVRDSHLNGYVTTDQGDVALTRVTGGLVASSTSESRATEASGVTVPTVAPAASSAAIATEAPAIAPAGNMISRRGAVSSGAAPAAVPTVAPSGDMISRRGAVPAIVPPRDSTRQMIGVRPTTSPNDGGAVTIIAGTVVDSADVPVAHAYIAAMSPGNDTRWTATTDANGRYRLIIQGDFNAYTVSVSASEQPTMTRDWMTQRVTRADRDDRIVADWKFPAHVTARMPLDSILLVQSPRYWRRIDTTYDASRHPLIDTVRYTFGRGSRTAASDSLVRRVVADSIRRSTKTYDVNRDSLHRKSVPAYTRADSFRLVADSIRRSTQTYDVIRDSIRRKPVPVDSIRK